MPDLPPPSTRSRPTRRAVLLGTAAAGAAPALAACTGGGDTPSPSASQTDPDVGARRAAAITEAALTAAAVSLASTSSGGVGLRARAASAAHQAHADALLEGLPGATPTPSASTTASHPRVSATALARAEIQAAQAYQSILGDVSDGLARLLASVAASDVAHATALRAASA